MKLRILTLALALALIATPAYGWTHAQHRVRRVIALTLQSRHVARPDRVAAITLAGRESGWNPNATNGSCLGLFQLKTRSPRWRDPVWNTARANTYVNTRYGSWRAALAHSYEKGWY